MSIGNETSAFWIIFDTGTKPEYFADVHELLALPRGAILRYDYRRKYLSPRADDAIFGPAGQPDRLLLAYAQSGSYAQGSEPQSGEIPGDMIFVPTRLARLVLVPTPKGETAYFDIAVESYPDPDSAEFNAIMTSLASAGETPYKKWVALSEMRREFDALVASASDAHWERIVDKLGKPPSQFVGGIFWRLEPPTRSSESRHAAPEDLADDQGNIYQVVSKFKLYQGHEAVLPVVSHMPEGTAGGADERRFAEVSTASAKLRVIGNGRIGLRRYSQDTARIRALQGEDTSTTTEVVSFATSGPASEWPAGPSFDLSFEVSKNPSRLVVAVLLIVASVILGAVGNASEGTAKVVFLALGGLCLVASALAFTGKLGKP